MRQEFTSVITVKMSSLRFYVVSALCLVLFGSLPCRSQYCTSQSINDCHTGFDNDFCDYFGDVASCLEELESACTDDDILSQIKQNLDHHRAISSKCPEMTHKCLWAALSDCNKEVPINVRNLVNERLSDKQRECNGFKGKDKGILQCFDTLKANCSAPVVDKIVDSYRGVVTDIVNICADLD